MAKRILIVDDEADLAELVGFNLNRAGYLTRIAHNGRDALLCVSEFQPDLIVLDFMMPGLSGTDVIKRLRTSNQHAEVPIIMLTAKTGEADELAGLDAGADDYVTKPFSVSVLVARIEAVLRRIEPKTPAAPQVNEFGPIRVDPVIHEVKVDGQPLSLTVTEFRVLKALVDNPDRVLSRRALIEMAMGPGVTVTERTIDVHVTAIRKKLGDHASVIKTVRGVGYRLVMDEPERASTD